MPHATTADPPFIVEPWGPHVSADVASSTLSSRSVRLRVYFLTCCGRGCAGGSRTTIACLTCMGRGWATGGRRHAAHQQQHDVCSTHTHFKLQGNCDLGCTSSWEQPGGYASSTGYNTHVTRTCATAGRQHATTEPRSSTHFLGGGLHHATPVHLAQLVHLAASTPCCNGKPIQLSSPSRAAPALPTMCGWHWVSIWFASLQCAQMLPTAVVGLKISARQVHWHAAGQQEGRAPAGVCAATGGEGGGRQCWRPGAARGGSCSANGQRMNAAGGRGAGCWAHPLGGSGNGGPRGLAAASWVDHTLHCTRDLSQTAAAAQPMCIGPLAWRSPRSACTVSPLLCCRPGRL